MLTYHVTIQRELIRTQTQTITVEATDATSAYALAETRLSPHDWDTDPHETFGEVYEVECSCEDGGWKHNFVTDRSSDTKTVEATPDREPTK